MLHCLNTSSGNLAVSSSSSDVTVLERQRARVKWQQDQTTAYNGVFSSSSLQAGVVALAPPHSTFNHHFQIPTDLPALPAPPAFDHVNNNSAISRTFSCPPTLADPKLTHSSNKRKPHNPKVVAENDNKLEKRIKVGAEDGESKITANSTAANNKENFAAADTSSNSKQNSKASTDVQKPDYIHVRARRGQATDSHSLAERVRREKISERMKYLQDLVPGCNKITGKAGMLDEIINYVQSLQRQVEFLSMKLATVNTRLDFNVDDLFHKEVFPTCDANANFPAMGTSSSEMNNNHNPYVQFNSPPQQIVSYGGLDTGMNVNPSDMGLRRTISAPVTLPETFLDSSSFSQGLPSSSTWEGDFQNIYNLTFDQARGTSFPSHLFTDLVEASNLKMEM